MTLPRILRMSAYAVACLAICTSIEAQDIIKLQDSLARQIKHIRDQNLRTKEVAAGADQPDTINYAQQSLRTGYEYRNVGYFEVRNPKLYDRIERAFAEGINGYERNGKSAADTGLTVTPLSMRVFLARKVSIVERTLVPEYQLLEIRVLKKKGGRVWNPVMKAYESVGYLLSYSSAGTELKFLLGAETTIDSTITYVAGIDTVRKDTTYTVRDSTLYKDILGSFSESDLQFQMGSPGLIRASGPYVVRNDSERTRYAFWFSGTALKPWRPARRETRLVSGDTMIWPEAGRVQVDLSMFRVLFTLEDWSLDVNVGSEELGYPFWSSGQLNLLVGYRNLVKLGIIDPVGMGKDQEWSLGGRAKLGPRALNGVHGFAGSFNFDFGFPTALGGAFSVGKLEEENGSLTDPNRFYYIPVAFQFYYPILFKDREKGAGNLFQLKLGYGHHRVDAGHVFLPGEVGQAIYGRVVGVADVGKVANSGHTDVNTPYISLTMVDLNENYRYGLNAQYYGGILILGGWVELFRDILRLEGKYVMPLRDKEPWDPSSILWFTPRVRFDLSKWFRWIK
jgi:hypothetical protein